MATVDAVLKGLAFAMALLGFTANMAGDHDLAAAHLGVACFTWLVSEW